MNGGLIAGTVVELLRRAHSRLPSDVVSVLEAAAERADGRARLHLRMILDDLRASAEEAVPMCEDTGTPVFYVDLGRFPLPASDIAAAIVDGVRRATDEVPLRSNAVHPVNRHDAGDNTGRWTPPVHILPVEGDGLEITVLAKGAGSENMSALAILPPVAGVEGIKSFVLDTVVAAGGNPCPPVIVGVGVGGTSDVAMALAKRALLRRIDTFSEDPVISQIEADLRRALWDLGFGPMGLSGTPTVIGVKVEHAHSHPASLAVGVNIQCWAARRASARLSPDGEIRFLEV
ncbi:MAG TPA: fumarate hydratase [Thermoplasmata archaeon]|nr:fumarate hydratase [Thermoplasmata archaeon]